MESTEIAPFDIEQAELGIFREIDFNKVLQCQELAICERDRGIVTGVNLTEDCSLSVWCGKCATDNRCLLEAEDVSGYIDGRIRDIDRMNFANS